jgi:hypothetical protein
MIRAIALSLALLIGIGAIVPLATDYAEAGSRKYRKGKKYKKAKKYKKYSKAWWRQYRARQQRKKSLAARRRALRLRQIRLARTRNQGTSDKSNAVAVKKPVETRTPALLPSGAPAPQGWVSDQSSASELQFRVADGTGSPLGSASISVVGSASGDTVDTGRNRAVGGVPTSSLRREVINRMIRENGWVVNDYQKEIGGQKVYVVVAQSQQGSGVQSRMFYFTEVEGRIYSVATNAPNNNAERLAEESEKVINSLQTRVRPTQQASAGTKE